MAAGLHIRPAIADDAGLILHFIRELAIYEKAESSVQTDEAGIRASLFGPEAKAQALFAKFKKCTEIYCALWQTGSKLEQLAVAV